MAHCSSVSAEAASFPPRGTSAPPDPASISESLLGGARASGGRRSVLMTGRRRRSKRGRGRGGDVPAAAGCVAGSKDADDAEEVLGEVGDVAEVGNEGGEAEGGEGTAMASRYGRSKH